MFIKISTLSVLISFVGLSQPVDSTTSSKLEFNASLSSFQVGLTSMLYVNSLLVSGDLDLFQLHPHTNWRMGIRLGAEHLFFSTPRRGGTDGVGPKPFPEDGYSLMFRATERTLTSRADVTAGVVYILSYSGNARHGAVQFQPIVGFDYRWLPFNRYFALMVKTAYSWGNITPSMIYFGFGVSIFYD